MGGEKPHVADSNALHPWMNNFWSSHRCNYTQNREANESLEHDLQILFLVSTCQKQTNFLSTKMPTKICYRLVEVFIISTTRPLH